MMRRRGIVAGLIAMIAGTALGQLQVSAEYQFEGVPQAGKQLPILVTVANTGPDAEGQINLFENGDISYPISLPRGSTKQITVYPPEGYFSPKVMLSTNRGSAQSSFIENKGINATYMVLHVSETSGELSFLRSERAGKGMNATTLYSPLSVRPDRACDRPSGYRSITAIVLGEGAERLSGKQVEAIRRYVLTGGTLLFVGGAASAAAADPRWETLIPITGAVVRNSTLPNGKVFTNRVGTPKPGAITARADGGVQLVSRAFGLGQVNYMSVNPTAEPFNLDPNRAKLMNRAIKPGHFNRVTGYLAQASNSGSTDPYGFSGGSGVGPPPPVPVGGRPSYPVAAQSNPFTMKLPPTESVAYTLIAYFFVVIPINFFVLRRMKRLELAWFTAPVISLAFAAALFQTASSLYQAQLSVYSRGVVVAQSGEPEECFLGSTQMFFPRAGLFDLKLKGIDYISESAAVDAPGGSPYGYGYGYGNDRERADLRAIDVGEVVVPAAAAKNLQFQQFFYRQYSSSVKGISVSVRYPARLKAEVVVRNNTSNRLTQNEVDVWGTRFKLTDLAPGKSTKKVFDLVERIEVGTDEGSTMLSHYLKTAILRSNVEGYRPGPAIGNDVGKGNGIKTLVVAEVTD